MLETKLHDDGQERSSNRETIAQPANDASKLPSGVTEPTGPWHTISAKSAFDRTSSSEEGLTDADVEERLRAHGPNRLTPARQRGPLRRFLAQFENVLIYVLLAAAVATAFLGHWVDTAVIVGVVVINAIIGFIQEGKAESALEAIRNMLSPTATVIREGRRRDVGADTLVPGDVVVLEAGDKVPADLRIFDNKSLRVQEAILTGESVPVEKGVDPVAEDAPLGDRSCLAYSGTMVTFGVGRGVVMETGDRTEIGRINEMLAHVETIETPLLRKIAQFGKWLTIAILALSTLTFAFGVIVHDFSMAEMFLAAVGIAVAAIPEGLPAIMTITLAIGVQRMARRNAIIRKLPAVETLGAVTVICSDKTGTLTRNEMMAQSLVTSAGSYDVFGTGYEPVGEVTRDGAAIQTGSDPVLDEMLLGAVLCSDAVVEKKDDLWVPTGDPTEAALVTVSGKMGVDADAQRARLPRLDVIPFDSAVKYMATLHEGTGEHDTAYVKGAPDVLLDLCDKVRGPNGSETIDRSDWLARMEDLAARGQRVLAVAVKSHPKGEPLTEDTPRRGLELLGLIGLVDPARSEAIEAVARCLEAGVRVKMITGDHVATARAIANQLGLPGADHAIVGKEIDQLSGEELQEAVARADVFARVTPEHKLRIVEALQANGEVCAMTGDGVNDSPALKRADVGVAMGIAGTDVAKEAAEMVLADDNFSSITHAVEEGRTIYDNIKKSIGFILPTNGGQAMAVMAAIIAGAALPITPVQILWVNMVTAVTLALALSFEPAEEGVMRRPPRPPKQPILTGFLLWRIGFVSALLFAGTMGLFMWKLRTGIDVETARTVAVNTLVMGEIFYLISIRRTIDPSYPPRVIFGSRPIWIAIGLVILLQLAFTYVPAMEAFFGTRPLDVVAWKYILMFGIAVFVLVEIEKWIIRTFGLMKRSES
ncbi:MAG: cation-transporting P-type ATPase [Rhodospirillales bacterium]|nr:cation-transporting P-type ATPase [Rhodospirillales bacterium]